MTIEDLKKGTTFKSASLKEPHAFTIETVTEKRVSWFRNDGLRQRSNVNIIRVFNTSRRIAEEYIKNGHWIKIETNQK